MYLLLTKDIFQIMRENGKYETMSKILSVVKTTFKQARSALKKNANFSFPVKSHNSHSDSVSRLASLFSLLSPPR